MNKFDIEYSVFGLLSYQLYQKSVSGIWWKTKIKKKDLWLKCWGNTAKNRETEVIWTFFFCNDFDQNQSKEKLQDLKTTTLEFRGAERSMIQASHFLLFLSNFSTSFKHEKCISRLSISAAFTLLSKRWQTETGGLSLEKKNTHYIR